jgi:hypothetical protein
VVLARTASRCWLMSDADKYAAKCSTCQMHARTTFLDRVLIHARGRTRDHVILHHLQIDVFAPVSSSGKLECNFALLFNNFVVHGDNSELWWAYRFLFDPTSTVPPSGVDKTARRATDYYSRLCSELSTWLEPVLPRRDKRKRTTNTRVVRKLRTYLQKRMKVATP